MSRFTYFFRRFFVTERQTPQTFALLECMPKKAKVLQSTSICRTTSICMTWSARWWEICLHACQFGNWIMYFQPEQKSNNACQYFPDLSENTQEYSQGAMSISGNVSKLIQSSQCIWPLLLSQNLITPFICRSVCDLQQSIKADPQSHDTGCKEV